MASVAAPSDAAGSTARYSRKLASTTSQRATGSPFTSTSIACGSAHGLARSRARSSTASASGSVANTVATGPTADATFRAAPRPDGRVQPRYERCASESASTVGAPRSNAGEKAAPANRQASGRRLSRPTA